LGAAVDQTENLTKNTRQQVGEQTQQEESEKKFVSLPPPLHGYFSALLVYYSNGEVKDAFASDELDSLHPLNADADGVINSSDEISVWEGSSDHGKVTVGGQTSSSYNISGPTIYLGQYNYLQWGYHVSENHPINVDIDNDGDFDYEVINKFWFVEGKPTSPSDIATLSGDYNYSGVARGTYYDPSGPVDGSGDYSAQVHFGSSYIQDFALNASGGGHTVSIQQSGSATINSNGEFDITSCTFKIDGSTVSDWRASGAHFGNEPAAEQGGVWAGACESVDKAAWGIFAGQGQKQ